MEQTLKTIESKVAEILYRITELVDGEKGVALIPYKQAQMFKVGLLDHIGG